jgi:hypothetical protein
MIKIKTKQKQKFTFENSHLDSPGPTASNNATIEATRCYEFVMSKLTWLVVEERRLR